MFLFFGLNHPNYSWWGSVHIRDMKSLNTEAASVLSKSWVVQKKKLQILHYTTWLCPRARECKTQSKGRQYCPNWRPTSTQEMVCFSPRKTQSRDGIRKCFETCYWSWIRLSAPWWKYVNAECISKRKSLTGKIREYGNPFLEISDKLIVLDSRICVAESCVKMMRDIASIGKRQYASFKRDIFQNDKDIQSPIKGIKFVFFSSMQPRRNQQLQKSLKGWKVMLACSGNQSSPLESGC